MRQTLLAGAVLAMLAVPATAQELARVTDEAAFVGQVAGRSLTALGVTLVVSAEGGITGRAFGRDVTGAWTWEDGYFCRDLAFGSRVFERNCQVVQSDGERVRFIADRGQGDTADLRLR